MSLPLPAHYAPDAVGSLFVERAGLIASAATDWRREHRLQPAAADAVRVAAFGIDCQVGFCHPDASLYVPGAVDDMTRVAGWLYRNLDRITTLIWSLDTHQVHQIFHPAWWADPSGAPPAPFTNIRAADVDAGRWIPRRAPEASRDYVHRLEETGRYTLTIWPYHTLLGGLSHALLPALMEATLFHAVARDAEPRFEAKGSHPWTESYSVLAPEVQELQGQRVGELNSPLLQTLLAHDRVYVFGEASSHCVRATLLDLLDQIQQVDPALARKVVVLSDAMSPVPSPPLDPLPPALDFAAQARDALQRCADAGMRLCTTAEAV